MGLLQGNRKFWPKVTHTPVDLSVGDNRSQIAAEWLQIAQRSQWRAYRKPIALLNGAIADPLPPPFPLQKWGFHMPQNTRMAISPATGDPIHFMFGSMVGFSGSADRMAVTSNPSWWQAAILDNFEWPYLRNGTFDPPIARIARSSLRQHSFLVYINFGWHM